MVPTLGVREADYQGSDPLFRHPESPCWAGLQAFCMKSSQQSWVGRHNPGQKGLSLEGRFLQAGVGDVLAAEIEPVSRQLHTYLPLSRSLRERNFTSQGVCVCVSGQLSLPPTYPSQQQSAVLSIFGSPVAIVLQLVPHHFALCCM